MWFDPGPCGVRSQLSIACELYTSWQSKALSVSSPGLGDSCFFILDPIFTHRATADGSFPPSIKQLSTVAGSEQDDRRACLAEKSSDSTNWCNWCTANHAPPTINETFNDAPFLHTPPSFAPRADGGNVGVFLNVIRHAWLLTWLVSRRPVLYLSL